MFRFIHKLMFAQTRPTQLFLGIKVASLFVENNLSSPAVTTTMYFLLSCARNGHISPLISSKRTNKKKALQSSSTSKVTRDLNANGLGIPPLHLPRNPKYVRFAPLSTAPPRVTKDHAFHNAYTTNGQGFSIAVKRKARKNVKSKTSAFKRKKKPPSATKRNLFQPDLTRHSKV